jgi:hypothetical protein
MDICDEIYCHYNNDIATAMKQKLQQLYLRIIQQYIRTNIESSIDRHAVTVIPQSTVIDLLNLHDIEQDIHWPTPAVVMTGDDMELNEVGKTPVINALMQQEPLEQWKPGLNQIVEETLFDVSFENDQLQLEPLTPVTGKQDRG